ncbi:MAG: (5-formylfuran-3-yl)methyl phosphate synthase [Ignisphaera sp.]
MKLLVSIKDANEVEDAILGGADIIDVKDPSTGSLGLPEFAVLKDVVNIVKSYSSKEVSMALGDISGYCKKLSYVAFSASMLNVDYLKLGIALKDIDEIKRIIMSVSEAIDSLSRPKLVVVGYADFRYEGFIEPTVLIDIAIATKVQGVMIDTFRKNGINTFNLLTIDYLRNFVTFAHNQGLLAAIAGGINMEHLPLCAKLGFDVVGVRGAVCVGKRTDRISRERVKLFKELLKSLEISKEKSISTSST